MRSYDPPAIFYTPDVEVALCFKLLASRAVVFQCESLTVTTDFHLHVTNEMPAQRLLKRAVIVAVSSTAAAHSRFLCQRAFAT